MPQQPFFDEDPFGIITDVHWPPKECPDPDPRFLSRAPYTGYYGWGSYLSEAGPVPFGGNQYPPFVGEVSMISPNKVGGLDCGMPITGDVPEKWIPSMSAESGDHAISLWLTAGMQLSFSTYRFYFEGEGPAQLYWGVPMSDGQTYYGMYGSCQPVTAPWIPQSYSIGAVWNFPNSLQEGLGLGVGFSHTPEPPPGPHFIVGAKVGGGFEYTYDFNFWEFWTGYLQGKYRGFTQQGQWDISLGGPLYFFLYGQQLPTAPYFVRKGGDWFAGGMQHEGDYYEWWVYAHGGLAFPPPDVPQNEKGDGGFPGDDGYPEGGPPIPPPPPDLGPGPGVLRLLPPPGPRPPPPARSAQEVRLLREQAAPLISGGSGLIMPPPLVTPRASLPYRG